MRLAPLSDALVGERLGKPIILPDGRVLLERGAVLSRAYIEGLIARGHRVVYVENRMVPGLEADADVDDRTRAQAVTLLSKAATTLQSRRGSRSIPLGPLTEVVQQLIAQVNASTELLVSMSLLRTTDDSTFQHSVNVAFLSLVLGSALPIRRSDLLPLGMGAMLHDLGKCLVPREILTKPSRLDPEEFEVMKTHTILGYQALMHDVFWQLDLRSIHVALSHHERLDGSGYPEGRKGTSIPLFSRIVAVADVWDALCAERVYKDAVPPLAAAAYLRKHEGTRFEADMVRTFLARMAFFPVGSIVRLADGRVGVIARQDESGPDAPWVVAVGDAGNRLLEPAWVQTGPKGVAIAHLMADYPPSLLQQWRRKGAEPLRIPPDTSWQVEDRPQVRHHEEPA